MDKNFLATIIEFLPDATFVVDNARKVVAWNGAIERMTGTNKSDILGRGGYAYAEPFYGKRRPILIDVALEDAGGICGLYNHVRKHGGTVYAEAEVSRIHRGQGGHLWGVAVPLFDGNGNLLGAIESIRDITDRKIAELSLKESDEKLRAILTEKERAEEALKKRESELEAKSRDLEELNTTLRVLLKQRERDRRDFEEGVLSNIEILIMPFLEKLKKCRLDPNHMAYVDMIGSGLNDVTSTFPKKMGSQYGNLTPAEIHVASLIKAGKTTKEISELLGVSPGAVNFHRNNIRKKLGLNKKKVNLASHLSSLS